MDPKKFGVRGQHYKVFPTSLPPWAPPAKVKALNRCLKDKLLKEIASMDLERRSCRSTDSAQSSGSMTGSILSGMTITSGGHVDEIAPSAVEPEVIAPMSLFQLARNLLTWSFH